MLNFLTHEMSPMNDNFNEELSHSTIDNSPEAIVWIDSNGKILDVNKKAFSILQYTIEELKELQADQIFKDFSISDFFEKELTDSRSIISTKSSEQIPVEVTSKRIAFEEKSIVCLYFRDIREVIAIEKAIGLNEERWQTGLEILSEGVWDWNLQQGTVEFSQRWSSHFGYESKADSFLKKMREITHPDDIALIEQRMREHLNGQVDEYRSKHRIKDSSGKWRWVRDRGKVLSRGQSGVALRMIGTTQDVTDIIEAEKQLRLSQEKLLRNSHKSLEDIKSKFLDIFNNSNDAIFIGDPNKNKIVDVNPKVCELLGYNKDELLNINLTEIMPNQKKQFVDFFNRVSRNKSGETNKLVFKSKSGERIFAQLSASIFSIDGELGILGIVHSESDEGKFERIVGQVTEASIVNPERGIVSNFMAETARLLRIRYAGMSRIIKQDPLTVRVVNFWHRGKFGESFEYEVKGSPCENVVAGDFHLIEKGVAKTYPNSQLLKRLKDVEGYMAVPISSSEKEPIGHFFLCDDGFIERKSWVENLMRLGALRMRLELERLHAQEALEEANQNLERKVEARTKALSQSNKELERAIAEVEELRDKLQAENVYLKEEIKLNQNFEDIISQDVGFKKVLNEVEKVAKTDSTVLIFGETGTGKEVITRSIHGISNRSNKPIVKVNCAALPATLIESELFGHEKGAFTGAASLKRGRFELADEGTLFLDEVGEIPLELQPKLLRALQEGEFERLGGVKTIKVNVRVIAATNRNLEQAIEKGEFRSDLFYRLNVFPITIPPLRERADDVPLLINHFMKRYNQKLGKDVTKVSQSTLNQLLSYSWPGNVRELENIIERGVIISEGKNLEIGNWLKNGGEVDNSTFKSLEQYEKDYILKVLKHTNWKVSGKNGAAEILNMKPTTLASRMKKLNISKK
ncbi:PAS domain S-box protein [Fulvivirga sp. RKSG066]|uniref:sigma 54-interacting transcriptional regulator n=1 Tax=Fulvivirga aurantia TaxID=2529383 RepID=UPI0012BCC0CC|nr:sigma 54-interacting transcriptional regulator [Fulvivirga aurantia]MTI22424.1 PAS domain S-box protein [Fulvivirga aurantia]